MRSLIELDWDSGWAVGSKTAHKLIDHLNNTKPKRILDIGSGLTTILFAEWANKNNAEVISLEHQHKYYIQTSNLLYKYNLQVDLRLCPLIKTKWGAFYKTDLPKEIDFVLIDGPPGSIGRQGTLYNIFPNLSFNCTVWLDDCDRRQEKKILEQWQRDLKVTVSDIEGLSRGKIIK